MADEALEMVYGATCCISH